MIREHSHGVVEDVEAQHAADGSSERGLSNADQSVNAERARAEQLARDEGGGSLDGAAIGAAAQAGFGDVSGVRVHTGDAAGHAARSAGAKAYAVGSDIFFGAGQYNPGSEAGSALLGHELAHTVQQQGAVPQMAAKLETTTVGDASEREADRAGDVFSRASHGEQATPVSIVERPAQVMIARTQGEGGTEPEKTGPLPKAGEPPTTLTDAQIRNAIAFNMRLPEQALDMVSAVVDEDRTDDRAWVLEIARFQTENGLEADGKLGSVSLQWMSQRPGGAGLEMYVASDATVYVGMNPTSRRGELGILERQAGAGKIAAVMGSKHQDTARVGGARVDLETEEGLDAFLATLNGLSGSALMGLRDFFGDTWGMGKDEAAELVKYLYEAEMGQRLIKRMVISGHSAGGSVWGDDDGELDFNTLATLQVIFPNALGQVEDLMLSACNTGHSELIDQYRAIFPNLKSVWGYVGYSPSLATGSGKHISQWEKSTRGAMDAKTVDAGRERVSKGSGKRDQNVAVWTRDHEGSEDYNTDSPEAATEFETAVNLVRALEGEYLAAYEDGLINVSALSTLYTRLQVLVGNFSSQLDDPEQTKMVLQHVLYLRHWDAITTGFMEEHGDVLKQAYESAGSAMPQFRGTDRSTVLEHIRNYPGDTTGPAYAPLYSILKLLDPELIPNTWM